jgi:hypothetical protein
MSAQPKAHKKLARNIGLGIGLVIILLIILFSPMIPVTYEEIEPRQRTETYWEKEPYQVKRTESKTLIDYKFTVPARDFVYYSVYIDVTGKEDNLVTGTVIETAGYDINFYVFDQKGFNAWWYGGSAQAYVDARRVGSYTFSFVPDHSDYYYFVLDNKYSWFTNKVPYVRAKWSYQITVTEYRDVQKTRTITEYVKVTKTKYVSLFQLLTGTA